MLGVSRYLRSKAQDRLEGLLEILKKERQHQAAAQQVTQTYRDFDKLCFSMSRLDGSMTIREMKELNTYEFYEHKSNLEDEARRRKAPRDKEEKE